MILATNTWETHLGNPSFLLVYFLVYSLVLLFFFFSTYILALQRKEMTGNLACKILGFIYVPNIAHGIYSNTSKMSGNQSWRGRDVVCFVPVVLTGSWVVFVWTSSPTEGIETKDGIAKDKSKTVTS